MLLSVGSLWTGLISAQLSFVGSRHSLTLPLGLGMRTKLLHHSAISSMPRGVMMFFFFNSSLNSFCSAYAMCPGALGMVYCLALPAMKTLHQNTLYQ